METGGSDVMLVMYKGALEYQTVQSFVVWSLVNMWRSW